MEEFMDLMKNNFTEKEMGAFEMEEDVVMDYMTDGYDRPDITKAQVVSCVQAVLSVLVAFGVGLSDVQFASLLGLSAVIAGVLCHSDGSIRKARNEFAASELMANSDLTMIKMKMDSGE